MQLIRNAALALASILALQASSAVAEPVGTSQEKTPLHMVVMDPLAAPLSCPCVEGYAQRQYEKLAEHLTKQLGRKVTVSFGESLAGAMEKGEIETAHIIIGKDSVVRADAAKLKLKPHAVARLSGKEGTLTQTGLIVVRSSDSAQKVTDLAGYRILYGPPECDEKFAAPRAMLASAGVEVVAAEQAETSAACSDGACKIIEWGDSQRAAAVISSYAAPLLEGCGTINKGDLRVVGETKPVPFVTAFVNTSLAADDQSAIGDELLSVLDYPELMLSLETLKGFVPIDEAYEAYLSEEKQVEPAADPAPTKPAATLGQLVPDDGKVPGKGPPGDAVASLGWTGWRGPHRNGHVRALPTRLPANLQPLWTEQLAHAGLGAVTATNDRVIIGDRNLPNTGDEFRCYDAATGQMLWLVDYPAVGRLDYDNTPRAAPLVVEGELGNWVYLLGAFGHLTCADLNSGFVLWQKNLRDEFGATSELVWGACSSPLLVDDKLIVNPGAANASLVALDPLTSEAIWKTPGDTAGYGSFVVATLGGKRQIVGHDRTTLGGWDIETGRRLWTLTPPRKGDFNVPTPIEYDGKLVVTTEGNGTRLYAFDSSGSIQPEPVAKNMRLVPDMSTPVVVGDRLFCVCQKLFCLDLKNGLNEIWSKEDDAFPDYAPIVSDGERLLIIGHGGELLLIDAKADSFKLIDRKFLFDDEATREAELYSHPAIVGTKLYVRGENALAAFDLLR